MRGVTELAITVPMRRALAPVAPVVIVDDGPPARLGPFELGGFLGSGGMGVVFEARHVLLGRRVALKILRPEAARSEKARRRLLREGQALARIAHPNVVTLFEVGEVDGLVFLAMELADGTLREWMIRPRAWTEVVDVFLAIGAGLAAMHERGLVHRDLNPSNVFMDADGAPKIGDFGLVGIDGDDDLDERERVAIAPARRGTLTTTGTVLGTPAYMPPEQLRGDRVDARADQYAFCASLHEALAGAPPDEGGDVRAIPRRLRPILARGLADEPDHRFASIRALVAELADARRGRARRCAGAMAGIVRSSSL